MLGYLENHPWKNVSLATLGLSLVGIATSTSAVVPGIEVALTLAVSAGYVLTSYTLWRVGVAAWQYWYPSPAADTPTEKSAQESYQEGYDVGLAQGEQLGMAKGQELGQNAGYHLGRENGIKEGRPQGYALGFDEGYKKGYQKGCEDSFEEAYQEGYQDGQKHRVETAHMPVSQADKPHHLHSPISDQIDQLPASPTRMETDHNHDDYDLDWGNEDMPVQASPQESEEDSRSPASPTVESVNVLCAPAPVIIYRNVIQYMKPDNLGHFYDEQGNWRSQRILAKVR